MRRLIIFLFFRLRMFAMWRYRNREKITILMLHGVAGRQVNSNWTPLWKRPSVDRIESMLKQLDDHYTFISLEQAVRIIEGSAPPVEHGMVVTFDDGYRNNFCDALPLFNEMNVPATFFVATGYVETGRAYWVDQLDYALQQATSDDRLLQSGAYEFDLRGLDYDDLSDAYRQVRQTLKNNESDDEGMLRVIDDFLVSLESASGVGVNDIIDTDPHVSIATWAEQKAACDAGATIGSHSVDHYRLTSIPRSSVDEQLIESRRVIQENLGIDCEFFCYPSGSYDEYIIERARSAGYRAAVTTEHGLNAIGDDLFALKRKPMPYSDDVDKNLLKISGFLELGIVKAALRTR